MRSDVILGYAIFDAENTTRLGDQPGDVQENYFARARDLLHAIEMRPRAEQKHLGLEIQNPLDE